MNRTNTLGLMTIKTNATKFKYLILGVLVIGTLISTNAYGTAFAGDSLNSINPNYQGDQSSTSS